MLFALVTALMSATSAPRVTSVELRHTNPSMGPHETKVTYTIAESQIPEAMKKLLSDSRVNGKVTLGEYVTLLKNGPAAALAAVQKAGPHERLAEGGTISALSFAFDDNTTVRIDDLRTVTIDGYYTSTFLNLLTTKGSKSVDAPPPEPGPVTDRTERPLIEKPQTVKPRAEKP